MRKFYVRTIGGDEVECKEFTCEDEAVEWFEDKYTFDYIMRYMSERSIEEAFGFRLEDDEGHELDFGVIE